MQLWAIQVKIQPQNVQAHWHPHDEPRHIAWSIPFIIQQVLAQLHMGVVVRRRASAGLRSSFWQLECSLARCKPPCYRW